MQFYLSTKYKDVWIFLLKNETEMLIKKIIFCLVTPNIPSSANTIKCADLVAVIELAVDQQKQIWERIPYYIALPVSAALAYFWL